MLTAQLQASTLVQMLLTDEREQRRSEIPMVPASEDVGLKATVQAFSEMRAAENEDGIDCAGNEVTP